MVAIEINCAGELTRIDGLTRDQMAIICWPSMVAVNPPGL